MKKIFMLLTSHRLDCLRLAMDSLLASDSLSQFDRVVLLLNGVVGAHLRYVNALMQRHPEIPWDTISGPRGKGPLVANLQNECVRRYPDSLYFKIDEDLFVAPGWVEKLSRAYADHQADDNLALITPVIPNNGMGFHYLLTAFPELEREYAARFPYPIVPDCDGPVWIYPQVAEWISRRFLDLKAANALLEKPGRERYVRFARRFSINCIVYDYRHWQQLGGIPDGEEPAWGQWVPDHGKFNVLVTDALAHHYSFFVQQDWLDRSSLLEDLRAANLPATLPKRSLLDYHLPRWQRWAIQMPRILKRRWHYPPRISK